MPRELRDNRLVETIYGVETVTPEIPARAKIGNAKLAAKKQKFELGPFDPTRFEPTRFDQKKFDKLPAEEQEAFAHRELDRRLNGYWLMINGELTWLPGGYYFELCYWHIDIGLKDYRDRDRRKWLFWHTCLGDANCFGVIYMKHRRDGATHWANCINFETASRTKSALTGIQSKTGKDATKVFNKLVFGFRKMASFFVPVFDGNDKPRATLSFEQPSQRITKNQKGIKQSVALDTSISHYPTVDDAVDGLKLVFYHGDEWGKCHTFGTMILMYDGTRKAVQDVQVGDLLMGEDSTPREVLSLTRGQNQLYDVVPNKGASWGCNAGHILCLRASSDRCIPGVKKDDIINIRASDYLKLPAKSKKHLMLWKVGVEYPAQEHQLEPYFMGIWLGDGSSRASSIATVDQEVSEYLHGYAEARGLSVRCDGRNNIQHHITCGAINGKNSVLQALTSYGVRGDKRIPREFMIDSRENRLQLLAGLVDSDGYKNGAGRYHYEITQKNETLARDIQRLAESLGFRALLREKKATMRRKDSSVYTCPVYRVDIYGENLHEVPCLIPRKKFAPKADRHKNTRNPLRTGFQLVPRGEGDYYGFTISGNHLYLLGDHTVTHNCVEMDVSKAWPIIKETLSVGAGTRVVGKALITSTVAEGTKKGGDRFKKVWDNSDPLKRNKNGRTISGLYRLFIMAADGLEGFIGEYGESIIDAPTPEQLAYLRRANPGFHYQEGVGALQHILNERQGLRDAGDSEGLAEHRRLYPLTESDAFTPPSTECLFDRMKLDAQRDVLLLEPTKRWVRGEFILSDKADDTSDVRFVVNDSGNWYVNKRVVRYDEATHTCLGYEHANLVRRIGGIMLPGNKTFGVGGVDPVDHDLPTDQIRASKFAASIFRKYDSLDPDNSHRHIARYVHRAPKAELMYEDARLAARYFGIQWVVETQKIRFIKHMQGCNHGAYLMGRPSHTHTKNTIAQREVGVPSSDLIHVEIHDEWEEYICDHSDKLDDEAYIDDLEDFDIHETRKSDLTMAGGFALIGARKFKGKRQQQAQELSEKEKRRRTYVKVYK